VVLVHREVVAREYVALMTCVDAPEVNAFFYRVCMGKYLLIVCGVRRFELHIIAHLSEEESASIWRLGVASRGNFSIEKILNHRYLGPG
jgi:hypothetical protein